MRKKKDQMIVVKQHELSKNIPWNDNSNQKIERLKDIGIYVEPAINPSIDVTIQLDPDPKDLERCLVEKTIQIRPETKYAQMYEIAENILFNVKNNLAGVDIFMFHFIVNRFADQEKFNTAELFFEQVIMCMLNLGMKPNKRSIQNSIYKLAKAEAIIKVGKNLYTVNSLLAYSGHTDNRNKSIQKQFFSEASYVFNSNKSNKTITLTDNDNQ